MKVCVAYIFAALWTGKFFGFLARSSDKACGAVNFWAATPLISVTRLLATLLLDV